MNMNDKMKNCLKWLLLLMAMFLAAYFAYNAGLDKANKEAQSQREELQQLNRSSIAKLNVEEGPIYVIGHCSPDSDTVCSAIAYARFLSLLGYDASPRTSGTINNETAYILQQVNFEAPEELIDASGENIFLVDHSEYAQAVEGMIDAHIVGVIDHHGVGTLSTGNQVLYEAKPIGCTSTIIWLDYLNYGLEIDETTAYLMLGAILSDTDGLSGSTTTDADVKAVEELSKLAKVDDVEAMYAKLHERKLSYDGFSDQEIIFSDYKEYEAGGYTFGIGLVNAIDMDTARDLAARMKQALPEAFESRNVDYMYVSVGMRENGEKIDSVVPANELSATVLTNVFPDYDEYDGTSYIFKTGLGRKTKFVPGFTDYLNSHPHE